MTFVVCGIMQTRRDYAQLFEQLSSNSLPNDDDFLPKNILVSIFKYLDSPQHKTKLFQICKRFFLVAHSLFYPHDLQHGYINHEEATNLTNTIHSYLHSVSPSLQLTTNYVEWLSLSEFLSNKDKKIQINQKRIDEEMHFDNVVHVDQESSDDETDAMLKFIG